MGTVRHNLSIAQARDMVQLAKGHAEIRCFFAGLIYDPFEEAYFRLNAPVEVRFGEGGELFIPLPTLDDYLWTVVPVSSPAVPETVTMLTDGPIGDDNVWEFRSPTEPLALGEPAIVDPDKHWPDWATAIRRRNKALTAEGLDAILDALGFQPPTTTLAPAWKSGLYVLHLSGGRYYVGQSVDLPSRLATHRRTYPDLQQVSLIKLRSDKAELDSREQEAIYVLERRGFPLLNIVHASITHQSSPFDDIVTPDEQRRWLERPQDIDHGTRPAIDPDVRLKQAAKLVRLQQRPDAERVIACLRTYVRMCIPRPAATEPAYWSVSCMPSTNAGSWPRLACFNSNAMELFVVGYMKDDPSAIWAFVNISNVAFSEAYTSTEQFQARYPGATVEVVGYVAAGHDQVNIGIQSLDQLEELIQDPGIQRAARLLNLHLMRKRTNLYARYHCYDLADLLLT